MKRIRDLGWFLVILIFMQVAFNGNLNAQSVENSLLVSSDVGDQESVVALEHMLDDIEGRYRVTFLYEEQVVAGKYLNSRQILSGQATGKKLAQVLTDLNLDYYKLDKETYVLIEKKEAFKSGLLPQQEIITGTVTDAQSGETLPGVNVLVKGTTTGTSTGSDGSFELNVPSRQDTLVFSFIGYQTQEVPISGRTTVDVDLQSQAIAGEELVVVGYGTQSTRQLSSSVQNISSEDLEDAPVAQVGQMLQGKLSGVKINQTTGRPGEGVKIQVRGAASITAGADPLYVVDGMPISGDIGNLNPSEIKSISVLKDAAATSLYGSRAANGVVLVETKTAIPGETRVDLNAYYGFENVPENRRLEMMNARQYAEFQKEIDEQNGRPVDPEFQNPDQYGEGTDWYEEITKTAPVQNYNLTVGTGSDRFNTSVTAGYFNQDGVIVGTGYQRISLRANTRYDPIESLSIGFNIAPNFSTNTNFPTDGNPYGGQNIVSSALITTPLASPYNEDGSLALTATDPATFGNPNWLRVAKERVYEDEDQRLLSNGFIEYEILDGLVAKTTANIQLSNSKLFVFNPSTVGGLFSPPPRVPSGSETTSRFYNWVNENTLTYQTQINDHSFDILAGLTAQRYNEEFNVLDGSNFPDDKVQRLNAAGQISISSGVEKWTLLSYLARLNYSYKDRYLVSASIRRDGSSRFGPENRWGNFPSGSIGWIVSEEDFWNLEPISFAKLRASYGIVGNFQIGNYSYIPTYGATDYAFGNSMVSGRAVNNLGDMGLGWERNKEFNIGADIYLINDRLQLEYNYYSKTTSDLLFDVQVPASSGFNNLQTNIGELEFWGHEISVNSTNIQNNTFSWNTNLNVSFDRNKVSSLATRESSLQHGINLYSFLSHRSQVGRSIGMFYGAIHDGVYVDQEDFNNSPKHTSSQVGTIKFKDLNNDGEITFPEDMSFIGNPWPDFTFGITNHVNYKDFDLSVLISGSYGNDILARHLNWDTNLDGVFNVLEEVKDRWKSPEDPGKGIYGSTQQGTTFLERDRWHSEHIKDGSYLSFKNITLGYTVPFKENSSVRRLRVYGSVQNAFILTSYDGPNPEVNTASSSSGSTPGVDQNSYPIPRTISLGVNLSF